MAVTKVFSSKTEVIHEVIDKNWMTRFTEAEAWILQNYWLWKLRLTCCTLRTGFCGLRPLLITLGDRIAVDIKVHQVT